MGETYSRYADVNVVTAATLSPLRFGGNVGA
jgi:hypothetical protein